MRSTLIDRIRQGLNREFVLRSLIRYFFEKGFGESFDAHIYPPSIQDIGTKVPHFEDVIEVVPHVDGIYAGQGIVRLGWNLFVLGTRRMYLGKTTHKNLTELKHASVPAGQVLESTATPRAIVKFVLSAISDDKAFVQPVSTGIPAVPSSRPRIGPTWSGGYYEKRRPVL
jgi:hypothetical protein